MDYGLEAQKAAETHLAACNEALWGGEDGDVEVGIWPQSPASAPFCGCDTCIVREVLHAAWPIVLEAVKEPLEQIAQIQPKTLATLRKHGVVFTEIGADPQNWQHVAFTIYTDLCEADNLARQALGDGEEDADDSQQQHQSSDGDQENR